MAHGAVRKSSSIGLALWFASIALSSSTASKMESVISMRIHVDFLALVESEPRLAAMMRLAGWEGKRRRSRDAKIF